MTAVPRANPLKEAMARGEPAIALWQTMPWAGVAEIAGAAGAYGVLVDLEHVSHGIAEAEAIIRAADAAGISALVRPARIDESLVSRLLDAGAHGIIFPRVDTRRDAERAVACTRYPPRGLRGWGGAHTRYARWQGGYARDYLADGALSGHGVYSPQYVLEADAHQLTVALIETRRGVRNVDEIVSVEGLDAVIFGWGDFSVEADFDEHECREAAAIVRAAVRARGLALGVSTGDEGWPGCFTIAGIDSLILSSGISAAVQRARPVSSQTALGFG